MNEVQFEGVGVFFDKRSKLSTRPFVSCPTQKACKRRIYSTALDADDPKEQKQLAKKDTKYGRKFVCDSCSYPPCSGCGLERTRDNKKQDFKEKMWFCRKCFWQAAETKQPLDMLKYATVSPRLMALAFCGGAFHKHINIFELQ